jgi:hypothetical protein
MTMAERPSRLDNVFPEFEMNIAAWLRELDLDRYERAFRDNDTDSDILRELTADDLIALGIRSVGHRRKLLAAIANVESRSLRGRQRRTSVPALVSTFYPVSVACSRGASANHFHSSVISSARLRSRENST